MTKKKIYTKSPFKSFLLFWNNFKKNKLALIGLISLLLLMISGLLADVVFNYESDAIVQNSNRILESPSKDYWLGTDELGRDILARIVFGIRVSIPVGFGTILIAATIGSIIGSLAGYVGGKVDNVLMRIMDMFLAIPSILLSIAIVAALGPNLTNLMIAISIANIPPFARVVRGEVMSLSKKEFVLAANIMGLSHAHIIFKHVLPNAFAPIIVQASLSIAGSILGIASLSFIGLGISPPTPEWGAMLSGGRAYITYAWWVSLFPGIAIMITVFSLNVFGDGLRDALDPKMKNR